MKITKPLELTGNITLPHRLMPGPMEGVMSPLFLKAAAELNLVDYWITPFVRISTATPRKKYLERKITHYTTGKKPVIVQLMGTSPELLAETAKKYAEMNIAGINLNFGCPSRKVISSGSGGALLRNPHLLMQITEAVKSAIPETSLSIKLRSGFESPDEMEKILPELEKFSPDFIMLHFRTVTEQYRTIDNGISRIKRAVELIPTVPLIASGDIFSAECALKTAESTQCAGIVMARGLLKDPCAIRSIYSGEKITKEEGREKLFVKIKELHLRFPQIYPRESLIELTGMIFGRNSPEFENIIKSV